MNGSHDLGIPSNRLNQATCIGIMRMVYCEYRYFHGDVINMKCNMKRNRHPYIYGNNLPTNIHKNIAHVSLTACTKSDGLNAPVPSLTDSMHLYRV